MIKVRGVYGQNILFILHSLHFDMQRDHFQKKNALLTGPRGGKDLYKGKLFVC